MAYDAQNAFDQLRAQQAGELSKLVYFLLGVASAAIGFTFHETADRTPSTSLFIFGIAIGCWCASFLAGALFCETQPRLSNMNAAQIMATARGLDRTELDRRYDRWARRASRRFYAQLATLLAGAIVYAGGFTIHVYERPEQSLINEAKPSVPVSR